MLGGQPCTIRTTDISTESDAAMQVLEAATIQQPQYARVSLGKWDSASYSFKGCQFFLPGVSTSGAGPCNSK